MGYDVTVIAHLFIEMPLIRSYKYYLKHHFIKTTIQNFLQENLGLSLLKK